ncbi:ATP-binding protein [Nonomuraea sp. NPDC048916]|uniref:ATP-binding protein n=1 Tax=Nonomuraea sp. NPDC048916 TaxID=3154232 RepID=UPI0033C0F71B
MEIRGARERAFTISFTRKGVPRARGAAMRLARAQGMPPERVIDLALVVNEAMVNAVAHGGGRGRLRMWRQDGALLCEIEDHGPGIPARQLDRTGPPPPSSLGGWGIWLIRRLADKVALTTGPDGTAVRIAMDLSERERAVP